MATAAELESEFMNPPDTARLWVYWTQSGHHDLESATADLESMHKAGIGGVLRMDTSVGNVPGGTPFLGEQWRKQFVHSVHECERLGMEYTTITGPGWTGTGGPWISAEQSMQHLVPVTVATTGPAKFNQVLPLPEPRVSQYHGDQTPAMRKQIAEFYQDVALFAVPTRTPVITDIAEKALHVRNPFTSAKGVRPYLPSPADHPAALEEQVINPESIIDLTGKLDADGRLVWDVPEGDWTIVRLGARSTGANTRPAPPAGLGLESDKFSKEALAIHFENYFDPLLKEIGPRAINRRSGYIALDADSWEMSSQNWTSGFRAEFKQRRGYDPWLHFTTYTGCVVGSREETERFLWDVRRTCQELLLENHAAELQRLCHERGLRLMIQPYDMNPAGDLDLGSYADYPAGEFWMTNFKSAWSCITASSIAHTMGKPVVLAEGFTSIGNWARSPWTLKNQSDWAFAIGINKFAIHGFAHQPNDDAPGMTFGPYGVFWNRKQTFWPMVRAYHDYLARCGHMLRQGVTVADILYLTPEGTPQVFQPPHSAMHDPAGWLPDKKGYAFDGCSPRILMQRAHVKDGRICFESGTSYRLLVLPRWKTMTPELLEKLIELVQAGATVQGAPPISSPSLSDYPDCDTRVKELAEKLWGKAPYARERTLGKGRVVLDATAPHLVQLEVAKDAPLLPGAGSWIWYPQGNPAASAPAGDVYFRYTLNVGPNLKRAVIETTADNTFVVRAGGAEVMSGDNFNHVQFADITSTLKPGENKLTITAHNAGPQANPAGLLAAIRLTYADGSTKTLGTDASWQASLDERNWAASMVLGAGPMAPWRLQARGAQPQADTTLYPDYTTTSALLSGMGLREDMITGGPIRYTHRQTATHDIYFLSNRSAELVEADCSFRLSGGPPQLWNPLDGTRRLLPQYARENGQTTLPLEFSPHESYFVVFARDETPKSNERNSNAVNFPKARPVMTLEGAWDLSFDPEWGGPEQVAFETLQDWKDHPDDRIKYYSGIATYKKQFGYQPKLEGDARIYLDLGKVHETARVRLNGKDLGVVWCAPWRVDISGALKAGGNHLEIEVANLWPNRLIGDASLPQEKRLTRTTANPYRAKSDLLPSGLLGPVKVTLETTTEDQNH